MMALRLKNVPSEATLRQSLCKRHQEQKRNRMKEKQQNRNALFFKIAACCVLSFYSSCMESWKNIEAAQP